MSETTILLTEHLARNLGERLQQRFPGVRFLTVPAEGELPRGAEEASGFFRGFVSSDRLNEVLEQLPELRWLHVASAGLDGILSDPIRQRIQSGNLTLTRTARTYDMPIGEYVIAAMFLLARKFREVYEAQQRQEWGRPVSLEISGSTVGIIGAGAIGREIAWRAKALGTTVLGVRRNPEPEEHYERMYGMDGLDEVLKQSDYVVLALPLTSETRYLITERELSLMKDSAFLINIGRGALIREADLVPALNEERIAGAVLDVFEEEPLPQGHPLWTAKNTIITPHSSGLATGNHDRLLAEFAANLELFLKGEPLNNPIREVELGY